jgi:hypothetical protein
MNQYDKIGEEDSVPLFEDHDGFSGQIDNASNRKPQSNFFRHGPLFTLVVGVLLGALVAVSSGCLGAVIFSRKERPSTDQLCVPETERYQCGNSTEEALALGCYFDLLSVSFVPWQCGDRELEAEFLAEGPWKYWADRHQTQELSQDELWSRPTMPDDSFHVTMRWHRMHCMYQWKKMHRALESGRRMDTSYKSYSHTTHCQEVFFDPRPDNVTGGTVSIHFDSC